ncbi:WUS-interacting protein 2 [Actinidia rufa]|uniref:WUS-interacting protein 2 n=1 Tax=Actinidia rufa TaxID=165716 RepID=A0A7J0F177_9ERIC|nr:WUS-interacting protein 2 [Actinidia rufa]
MDEIDGVGVAGGGGSTAGAMEGDEEDAGGEDIAGGGGLEGGGGGSSRERGRRANNLPVNILPVTYPVQGPSHSLQSSEYLPKTVVANLNQGSFCQEHGISIQCNKLFFLCGMLVASRGRLSEISRFGTLEDVRGLYSEYTASVNRVMWSPDGTLFGIIRFIYLSLYSHAHYLGVLHTPSILCIYAYHGGADIRNHLEFIFSTGIDEKIKAWFYDNAGSRVDYDAPGHSCTTMAYSADGTRLFSCGTTKEGESHIVDWNENEGLSSGCIMVLGSGLSVLCNLIQQKVNFWLLVMSLVIKFWDMENTNLLTTTDAEGGLPASPYIRFSKEGILLAVSTSKNGVKILANSDSVRLM